LTHVRPRRPICSPTTRCRTLTDSQDAGYKQRMGR
jgi:hypothetical protein